MTTAKRRVLRDDQAVIYVYGVARTMHARQSVPPQLEGLVARAPVGALTQGDLTAFISVVPAAQFSPTQFHEALKDTEWLKERILAHDKVLERLRFSYDVVPFRFGTIYRDTTQAAKALADHCAALGRALDRIEGAAEWGVKLYCDEGALRHQIESESEDIRRLCGLRAQASPGARFFLQKKYDKVLDSESAAAVTKCVEHVRQSLDRCARESVAVAVQPPSVHGRSAAMVMNVAYLVAAGTLRKFRRAIATLQRELIVYGFSVELTGPWPTYHFVSLQQEGTTDAAGFEP
jgi:hypothetical protein